MTLAAGTGPAMQPLFLSLGNPASAGAGARFAVLHRPIGVPTGLVVFVHPFADEMNKARRMVALQARALAQAGHAVLLPDLLGCGDSAGDLTDARWEDWVDDIVGACHWMRQASVAGLPAGQAKPPPLTLWGLRAGVLLATAAAERLGDVDRLLLWQPATNGKALLQQFLRLHSAADLLNGSNRGGIDALRTRLADGQTVEVAGYRLPPALAAGLAQAQLSPARGVRQLHWLDLSTREDTAPKPAAAASLAAWRQAGTQVDAQVAVGPAFWQTAEIEDAPALIAASLAALTA